MTPWLGALLHVVTVRNGIHNGRHVLGPTKPSFPRMFSNMTSSHCLRSGAKSSILLRNDSFVPVPSSTALRRTTGTRRNMWDWRGGDDRKWSFVGQWLQKPKEEKEVSSKAEGQPELSPTSYVASVCTTRGFRNYMEDEYFMSFEADFAAVFDGHGGRAVSRYLRKNLYANVQAFLAGGSPTHRKDRFQSTAMSNYSDHSHRAFSSFDTEMGPPPVVPRSNPTVSDYQQAIESAFEKVDREVQKVHHWSFQGSTAVAVWIHEFKPDREVENSPYPDRTIIAANIGDSRAVLCRNYTAWDLTRDHKPSDPAERARVEEAGGVVAWVGEKDMSGEPVWGQGVFRINGNLAVSRTIGDRAERPHVNAQSEMIAVPVQEDDAFVLLASDGLWDVMESDEAVDFVLWFQSEGHNHDEIATLIVEEALGRGAYDNITVLIIWLHRKTPPDVETDE
eukprot:Nitzschia sp. Nitz4//scaffold197_size40390//26197//27543//NITZ4_007519-RA/size40390-processed-gene-0.9-mRNA-1//1//CDS//3329540490//4061//frame0